MHVLFRRLLLNRLQDAFCYMPHRVACRIRHPQVTMQADRVAL
jgi:hypothetical protein